MAFKKTQLDIPEVLLIETEVHRDERGLFAEAFKSSEFETLGINESITQIYHSNSQKDVLRGLHYQLNPKAQGKFVSVVEGEIFDVAVDIRKDSPTYGKYVSMVLSSKELNMLYIPKGFAHGFCTLSDEAKVLYFCTEEYAPELARGIKWDDQTININWPIKDPILSEKDKENASLNDAENNF